MTKQRIARCRLRQHEGIPPNLVHGVRVHTRAERGGEELRAEADAERRDLARDRSAQDLDLVLEVPVAVPLVDVHRAAEDDDPGIAANVYLRCRLACEVHIPDSQAGVTQERIEYAERLARHVLQDEELPPHEGSIAPGCRTAGRVEHTLEGRTARGDEPSMDGRPTNAAAA